MREVITLAVWKDRKDRNTPFDERYTEAEAAATRGWVNWKIENKRAMDERDGLVKPKLNTPRPWPPVGDH